MKNTLLVGILLAQATAAMAYEQNCELAQADYDDRLILVGKSIDLRKELENESIDELSGLAKQQLVVGAKKLINEHIEVEIESATQAARLLIEGSEANDAYLSTLRVPGGEKYTRLIFYPGGNPYGVYFEYGTKHIVATINDGDVNCLE